MFNLSINWFQSQVIYSLLMPGLFYMEGHPASDQAEFTHTYDPRSPQVRLDETANARSNPKHRELGDSLLKRRKLVFGRTESCLVPQFAWTLLQQLVGWEAIMGSARFCRGEGEQQMFFESLFSSLSDFEGHVHLTRLLVSFPSPSVNAVFAASIMDYLPMTRVVDLTRASWRLASRMLLTLSGTSPSAATSSSYWTFASSRLVAYPSLLAFKRCFDGSEYMRKMATAYSQ